MMAFPDSDEINSSRLAGTFYKRGKRFRLSLTNDYISWKEEAVQEQCTVVPLNQLIAVHPCDCSSQKPKLSQCQHCSFRKYRLSPAFLEILPSHAQSLKLYYAIPHRKSLWKLKSEIFSPVEVAALKVWLCNLQKSLTGLNRPKKLLVFLNPYGGKKRGLKIYQNKVAPLLLLAGIEAQVVVTQRPNHAKDILQEIDIYKYDGVVGVGGDGIFSEVVNGVLLKTQKEQQVDVNDVYSSFVVPRVSLGIIPAGSTNAAAFSAMGTDDPVSATLLIVMGDSVGLDVCSVHHDGRFLRFAVTFLSYGYFGDVILDSDNLRCLGPSRYTISGLKKLMERNVYKGDLRLKISCSFDRSIWEFERCRSSCSVCEKAKEKAQNLEVFPEDSENLRWISVPSQFMSLSMAILSGTCRQTKCGISQSQHIGNGYCDAIIVSASSRLDYLRYTLRTVQHYKNPFDLDFVCAYRIKEFAFTPHVNEDKMLDYDESGTHKDWQPLRNSVWNCDGEVLHEASLYGKMHCQLVNVFGRGMEVREEFASGCLGFCKKTKLAS